MERNRDRLRARGLSRAWRGVAVLAIVVALVVTGTRYWSVNLFSEHARPRLIAERGQLTTDEDVAIQVFNTVSPSVVFITSGQVSRDLFHLRATESEEDAGSGFIWDPNGYIVTNYHVVANSEWVRVALTDQSVWTALRVGINPDQDIAVLKIDAPADLLPPIPIGTSSDLRVGQQVFALGNPFGYDQTMTAGIISGLGREISGAANRPIRGVIQTDAAMNPGNSGGPLLDSAGRVIGMNTAILSPTGADAGIGFAVPIDCINRIVPRIIRGEEVPSPNLGVSTAPDHLVRRLGLEGVLIVSVSPNTSASRAQLHGTERNEQGKIVLGDLITAVDGKPVRTTDDLHRMIDEHKVGDNIRLTILREGAKMNIEVQLDPLP
jgi:S1-C subfamily serine protease